MERADVTLHHEVPQHGYWVTFEVALPDLKHFTSYIHLDLHFSEHLNGT